MIAISEAVLSLYSLSAISTLSIPYTPLANPIPGPGRTAPAVR